MELFDAKEEQFDRGIGAAWKTGVGALIVSLLMALLDRDQFFRSYLQGYVFWVVIPLGSLAFIMVLHLTGGAWAHLTRRIFEAAVRTLPFMFLLFLPILFGMESIYEMWLNPHGAHADVIEAKSAYLNKSFWINRSILVFLIWIALGGVMVHWSRKQDETGDETLNIPMRKLSGIGLLIWGLTVTVASWDWTMSLEPAWFSSMWGPLFVAQAGLSTLAFTLIVLWAFCDFSPLKEFAEERHFHDLGNLTFAFVILWTYMTFSSFLIIWSANLPEGILWYQQRASTGWQIIAVLLTVFHFVVPFFLLLSRYTKLKLPYLGRIAVFILLVRPLDIFWIVAPTYTDGFRIRLLDLSLLIAIGAFWLAMFLRYYRQRPMLALHDPRFSGEEPALAEGVDHD